VDKKGKVAVIVGDGLQGQARRLAKGSKVISVLASRLDRVLEAQPSNASIGVFVHSSHLNLEHIIRLAAEYVAPTFVIGGGSLPAGPCPGNWVIAKGWGAKFAPAHQYIPEKISEIRGEYDPDGFYLPARIGDGEFPETNTNWDPDLDGAELYMKDKQKLIDDTASYFLSEQQYWDMEKYSMLRVIL